MNKTTVYGIAIVVLLLANGWLFFSEKTVQGGEKRNYFDAENLEKVSFFLFHNQEDTTKIEKTANGWVVNDQYRADERFLNTLFSIIERIESGRKFDGWNEEVAGAVEIGMGADAGYRFQLATNPTKTKSFFIAEGVVTEVSVPGYRDNVVDIFLLHPDQWRDRLVIDASWRSIQKLTVSEAVENLTLTFDDKFFLINGQPAQDSSAVVDYLNQFQYFEANEMISPGRFPKFDSLAKTTPTATVEIDDIKLDKPMLLNIFPKLDNQAYHLVTNENGMMVIDAARVQQFLASVRDFE